MEDQKEITSIRALKSNLIDFQQNDLLVNIRSKSHLWECISGSEEETQLLFPFEGKWEKLYYKFNDIYRETGVQTACLVSKTILWEYKGRQVESPLLLFPLEVTHNKNLQTIEFLKLEEQKFVNPFIEKYFKEQFELELTIDNLSMLQEQLLANPVVESVVSKRLIGQFHYHRFLLLKELEEIEEQGVSSLLGVVLGDSYQPEEIQLPQGNLLFADPTQEEILQQVGKYSFVLQGPPGTGKSQVLINIIGKLLQTTGVNLVISEKRSALEVIRKKLCNVDLSGFAIYLDDQTSLKSVYAQMKNVWERLSEEDVFQPMISTTPYKMEHLQLILDRLHNEQLSSGISFWDLKNEFASVSKELIPNTSKRVTLSEWKDYQPLLQNLHPLPWILWRAFPSDFWKKDRLLLINAWFVKYIYFRANLNVETLQDLHRLNHWGIIAQIHNSARFKDFIKIVQSDKSYEKFKRLKKKYINAKSEWESKADQIKNWKWIPTEEQLQDWVKLKRKWLGSWRIKKILNREFSPGISLETLRLLALEYHHSKEQLSKYESELVKLGIFYPEQDFLEVDLLNIRFHEVSANAWQSYEKLPEDKKYFVQMHIHEILDFSSKLTWFSSALKFPISDVLDAFTKNYTLLLEKLKAIQQLPENLYFWLQQCDDLPTIEQQLIVNEWSHFQQLFPEMAQLDWDVIKQQIEEIIELQGLDHQMVKDEILHYRRQLFAKYEYLILQIPSKLSLEERQLRVSLKKGKSILVREMMKTRQHMPLRILWQSEANHWLQVLAPIWLATPTHVAKHFPNETSFFKFALIDEASQMPVSHAAGALQRAQQVIIAGDSQQMAPSHFFQSEDKIDILTLSKYYFKIGSLRYHYRSKYVELIKFSNRYFYDNQLEVFPLKKKPEESPLQWHLVADGIYFEQRNLKEAEAVAREIERQVILDAHLGIVAFSEKQLQTIWRALSDEIRGVLQQRIESNTVFFKALDKVQGDECDNLIISLGYGRDEAGNLHLHWGPILNEGGEKRLNVLFSRAKEQIDCFTSIRPEEIPLSDNTAVQMLKNYLSDLSKPLSIVQQAPDFKEMVMNIKSADELVAKFRIYKERGWF